MASNHVRRVSFLESTTFGLGFSYLGDAATRSNSDASSSANLRGMADKNKMKNSIFMYHLRRFTRLLGFLHSIRVTSCIVILASPFHFVFLNWLVTCGMQNIHRRARRPGACEA